MVPRMPAHPAAGTHQNPIIRGIVIAYYTHTSGKSARTCTVAGASVARPMDEGYAALRISRR